MNLNKIHEWYKFQSLDPWNLIVRTLMMRETHRDNDSSATVIAMVLNFRTLDLWEDSMTQPS